MFKEYLEKYNKKEISQRQLCYYAKLYENELIELTSFLNNFENVSINERLYYILNNLTNYVHCKYCNNKAIWTGRLNEGYKDICNCKDCRIKQLSDTHNENSKITENRNKKFIIEQQNITEVNDEIIKSLLKYDKLLDLVDNELILNYLDSRYKDSSSRLETLQRIRFGIEEKLKCPTCGNPVNWIGKTTKLYTTYCSNKCSAHNQETTLKKKATQLTNWGTENCYDSEKYKQHLKETLGVEYHTQRKDIIEKRKDSLIEHYGTTSLYNVDEIKNKILKTNNEKFGYEHLKPISFKEIYKKYLNNENILVYFNKSLQNEYKFYKNTKGVSLNLNIQHNNIIKHFQGENFYHNEMKLYVNDPIIRRKLIQNRMKYLNKKENELTPNDILTGFKKSGLYYGYSHFNPLWTNWFINKYNIKTIYDPCGGWGHHLLGMLNCDKIIYNDFSEPIVKGVQKIKDYFNIDNLEIHYGDACKFIPENVDAFFMCPPYFNTEKYFCNDFASIDEYKTFLKKIFEIWIHNSAKYFGIIIREDLIKYINCTPDETYDLNISKSHFLKGKKKYSEKFYIFKK